MNKKLKWIIAVVLAVLLMVGVYFLYGYLTKEYDADDNVSSSASDVTLYDAPDFVVYDVNGNEVKLSDYFGKPIVLNFWATWCYYCTEEMPHFNEVSKENDDVVFLMVNVTDGVKETVNKAKSYIDEKGYEFTVLYDTTLNASRSYGVSSLPLTFFINKDGKLVTYARGSLNKEVLLKIIEMIK